MWNVEHRYKVGRTKPWMWSHVWSVYMRIDMMAFKLKNVIIKLWPPEDRRTPKHSVSYNCNTVIMAWWSWQTLRLILHNYTSSRHWGIIFNHQSWISGSMCWKLNHQIHFLRWKNHLSASGGNYGSEINPMTMLKWKVIINGFIVTVRHMTHSDDPTENYSMYHWYTQLLKLSGTFQNENKLFPACRTSEVVWKKKYWGYYKFIMLAVIITRE